MPLSPIIHALRPNVTRDEALNQFTGGLRGALTTLSRGSARGLAELYIPYHLFHILISNDGREARSIYAIDAVAGILDPFEFPQLPDDTQIMSISTRNLLPIRLAPDQAREMLLDKVRRHVFSRGFSRLRDLHFSATPIPDPLYFPYWLCFRGSERNVKIEVLDALRRRIDGAKTRSLVHDWLRSPDASAALPFPAQNP
jgi:hypothetical protein